MEKAGRATARAKRGRYDYQGPNPRIGEKTQQCLAPYGAQGAPYGEG